MAQKQRQVRMQQQSSIASMQQLEHKSDEELQKEIIHGAKRGLTVLPGQGGYSGKDVKVLMVTARKSESQIILRLVKKIDPNAFITMGSVMGVYGQGFDSIKN